ncbi:conserved Plasmodium protein, unknown function [Plasmodium knowlesi strain H]|uniref:Uncharacterized protein n=3 Tax=Plasmodium knowlesi TaxID=5850 RepID=A0A5K1VLG3_PLAKH|nr:conserved Plasmodium protein, unknown function [Plasmodium knowlesi strain H]OTN68325.1 Uncharacterized protein PKNOH_S03317800 [Plasmodium knowlesi]CAA9987080.1 conserved Plasmodium protein, unknown function [Plasmodium knowlesi strain H]SBO23808.1 conserved Plasmodium protein, unknown function [Plasmodium knowlesi strain H]SBO25558.1 conserved Plasmodium protein, unknown function [Plasmodium knowlesi strain H]VVS76554.1 conserved Plasmodium protein, unknown function [Plasmodium knowlesi s|eukprot:XP_002261702.1 hypothetical protein, conserved in Plasmodium species [Plasmodium knowlesi strain H]
MEEEKPDEDEEVTVGKNIIHNNFENADFFSNFHFLLDYRHHHPVHQFHERHWPCGVKNSQVVGTSVHEGGIAPRKTGRAQATRRKIHSTKKLIIHLVPSSKSNLYNFLKKKKEQVQNIYGKDETYKYESHISLTGYFFCDNIFIFTKSLCLYLFHYVKLYHFSTKLSVRDLFFYIPCRVGASPCDDRRALWVESRYRLQQDEGNRTRSQQEVDWKTDSKPRTCNVREKHILTTKDGYVIIPIMCEWLKKFFENFQFLIKNDSFASCRKYRGGGNDRTSRRYLRKRPALREEDDHFVGAKDRKYRVKEEEFQEIPSRIHSRGENGTGVKSFSMRKECSTTGESRDTPLTKHNGDDAELHSCVRPVKGRYSVSSVSTSASSGDLGMCSEVAQVSDSSPAMKPAVCEKQDRALSHSSSSSRSRNNPSRTNPCRTNPCRTNPCRTNPSRTNTTSSSSGDNKIKYRYNNAKVRLLQFRIKNCNHISLASNRKDQGVQNEIAHMYRDMKYYFSNCTWDMVMFECVEEGCNTHMGEEASESFPGRKPHLNEIFRFRNFAIS